MSKTHLAHFTYGAACSEFIMSQKGHNLTMNWEDVTCENCKRTNEYKRLKAEADQKLKDEVMSIKDEVMQEKTCANCANRVGEDECSINTRYDTDESGYCSDWKLRGSEPPPFSGKYIDRKDIDKPLKDKTDPAINLLNEFAEMLRLSELTTDEKLKVVDFIESRVRQGKL